MKVLTLLIYFFFFLIHIENSLASDIIVNNYTINTKVSFSSKSVQVNLVCNLRKNTNSQDIQFLFNSSSDLKSVSYLDKNEWRTIVFGFNGKDSLLLSIGNNTESNRAYEIKFEYSLTIEDINDTLLLLDRGHRWYPLINNQIFTYNLKCEVPDMYQVLSSGNLTGENNSNGNSVFEFECSNPVFKLPLIIFKKDLYKCMELVSEENKIEFYSQKIDSSLISYILHKTDSTLNYFTQILGPYSHDKLIFFEVSDFGGVNVGSGLLTIGTQSVKMIEKGYLDILILNISQQWYTANVFADFDSQGFFFFTISLPHYLRLMYVRDSEGEDAYNKVLLTPIERYKEIAGTENDVPIISIDMPNTREKGLILYAKGPYVLSLVEKELGIENWELFLRDTYDSFSGKIMTLVDFENHLAKYDSNGETVELLTRLLNEKGLP